MRTAYNTIDVIIADDHEIFRDGFAIMVNKHPDLKLLGEAANGLELVKLVEKHQPDVVVTDIKMPLMDGIEATKQILEKYPHVGVIALSMFDEDHLIVEMLEAGAKGYLLKNAHKDEIAAAIKAVHRDEPYYCRNTSHKLAQLIARSNFTPDRKAAKPHFTKIELEIIRHLCNGESSKIIADHLQIATRTVETHRHNILKKIDAKNTASIVVYAVKNKIC